MIRAKSLVIVGSLAKNPAKMGRIGITYDQQEILGVKVWRVVMPDCVEFYLEKELKNLLLTDAPDEMSLIAPLKKD